MKKVSAETIISWHLCKEYPPERIRGLFGTRKFATAKQILEVDLPPEDLLWCVLRPEFLDDKTLRLFACWCPGRPLRRERKAGREPAEASWEAVRVAKRFAHGQATKSELEKARTAAYAAAALAWSPSSPSPSPSADAAWSAARSAVDAAWEAARSAAWEAANSMAWEAESAAQVKQLKKMLG